MKKEKLLKSIGSIDDKYILEAEPKGADKKRSKGFPFLKYASIVAGFAVVIGLLIIFLNSKDETFTLELSEGVKVHERTGSIGVSSSADLEWLTEEELFVSMYDDSMIVAFEGEIKKIQNIEIDYGNYEDYRAIATIKVTDVLRGDVKNGSTIQMLIPGPINTNVAVSETTYSSQMREGMQGIFMPIVYDEKHVQEIGSKRFVYLDIAQYGLLDGERWLFLKSGDQLIFNEAAYPSLAGITDFQVLKEKIQSKLEE